MLSVRIGLCSWYNVKTCPSVPWIVIALVVPRSFFRQEGCEIMWHDSENVIPIETLCNGKECDRLEAVKNTQQPCGCWNQVSRVETKAKNVVLKFPFYFRDCNGKIRRSVMTSLQTSLLFFADGCIHCNRDTLNQSKAFSKLQLCWKRVITHVNRNGGWTIVGWFKRALIKDSKGEEKDGQLCTHVKINVVSLRPTTTDIPRALTFTRKDAALSV